MTSPDFDSLGIQENLNPLTGRVNIEPIATEYIARRENGASLDNVREAYDSLRKAIEYNNEINGEEITD